MATTKESSFPAMEDTSRMMKLSHDIFLLISHMMTKLHPHRIRDVAALSRTCRRLHVDCAPLLLGPRKIYLFSENDVRSFCRFMLSDPNRRFPILSCCPLLEFGGNALPEPVVDLLIEILGQMRATTLPRLGFLPIDDVLFAPPRLLPAFASLTCVQSLEIYSSRFIGIFSYVRLFKTIQSPIKAVKLKLPHHQDREVLHVTYSRDLDPLWLFTSISSTLESITLLGRTTVEACSVVHVYPRLTHLSVFVHCMPIVRPYIDAFPALRVLRFNYRAFWENHLGPGANLLERPYRGKSPQDLRTYNREDQLVHGSWPALESFMANTLDAYRVAFTCHIPSLHLVAFGGNAETDISAICAVFADVRPSHFRLALRPLLIDYIPALFDRRVELFSSLSSLELRLDVNAAGFDFSSYLKEIGTGLQHLSIVSLQVEIKCIAFLIPRTSFQDPIPCDDPGRWGEEKDARCYTVDALSREDMESHMRYYLQTIRTLRRVTIAWGRCRMKVPDRFVGVDLDNVPHNIDRPGRSTDNLKYWRDGY